MLTHAGRGEPRVKHQDHFRTNADIGPTRPIVLSSFDHRGRLAVGPATSVYPSGATDKQGTVRPQNRAAYRGVLRGQSRRSSALAAVQISGRAAEKCSSRTAIDRDGPLARASSRAAGSSPGMLGWPARRVLFDTKMIDTDTSAGPSVVRPLGFEPRTCGLRGEEKLSRRCCVIPLTWFFVRTGVHLVRSNPVYWHQFATEFSTKHASDLSRVSVASTVVGRLSLMCNCSVSRGQDPADAGHPPGRHRDTSVA